jgi:hypothetical protein
VDQVVQECPLKKGAIWTLVKDDTGKGVATIEFSGPGTKKSDDAGFASFDPLSENTYPVTATTPLPDGVKEDFHLPEPITKQVPVKIGQITQVIFQLKRRPTPTISTVLPKIVLVKHDYQGKDKPPVKVHRIPVKLGYEGDHDGVGELSCDHPEHIKVFDKEDDTVEKALPWKINADELKGKTVYVEGKEASGSVGGTELKLTLKEGTIPPKKDDATEKITCVLLKLDIYKARPEDNSDPVIVEEAKKIDPGRAVLVQGTTDKRLWAQRAKLVVAKAKPADYAGKLILKPITDAVQVFAADKETPAAGQTALSGDGLKFPNGGIDEAKGTTLWVQGKTKSAKLSDTGWTVEIEDLPDKEGDRVTMTVIKAELALYKSRTDVKATVPRPSAFSDDDKFDKGRYVHWQDGAFHQGRALIVVKKVEPDDFEGKLVLTCFDSTHKPSYSATKAVTPKVKVFEEEVAASGQAAKAFPFEIDHPKTYPADGKEFWVEGATVSAALADAELRLGVQEIDNGCDRVEFTVVKFKKIKADIPSTPAQQVRNVGNGGASNSPVPRHELLLADPPADKNYDEDFGTNEPLVLIEDSVTGADPVKMTVEIEPAGLDIPVRWSRQRDKTATTGDHQDIRALKGNDDLTLTRKGDGADALEATLLLDNVGSFYIRPFIDCNDNDTFEHNTDTGARIDRDPFIIMTLVVIRVVGVVNNSVSSNASFDAAQATVPGINYNGGQPANVSTGDFAGTGNDAVSMDATARVIGGGADGKRGLDKLFAGWLNNETNAATSPGPGGLGEDVTHHYQRPIPPAPPPPTPAPPPPPVIRTRCYWEMDGAEISGPMLDSGAYGAPGTQGTGGNTCTGTAATNDNPIAKTDDPSGVGQRWQVTNVDSPGGGITPVAATDALATVRRFKFNIDFQCGLVFWTNRNGVAGPDDYPACRLYVTVQTNTWNIRLESTFDDAFTETVVVARAVTFNKDGSPTRTATPVAGSGLESRRPDGLDQLQADVVF